MDRQKQMWALWSFWVVVTISPLIVSILMFVLGLGFDRVVWAGTLLVAFFGFFKAQQAVARVRSLAEDKKIEHWLAAIRRKRTTKRLKANQNPDTAEHQEPATKSNWQISPGWTSFRKRTFWRQSDEFPLIKRVGDLFHLLGIDVRKIGISEQTGQCLLVNGNTVVAVAENGARSASESAEDLCKLITYKATFRAGILISPSGFRIGTRNGFDKAPLILLDADNLSELSRRYIG